MKRIIHHVKKHGKAVGKHIRKHHHKYIFGAISSALVYKTLALIITAAAINPTGITFASGTVDTGTEYTGIVMTGDFVVNNDDSSTTGLDVIINNNIDGATHMRFGNTESDRNIAAWDIYSDTQAWVLDDNGTGTKIVYAQFSGNNASGKNIILDLQDNIEYILETQEDPDTNSGSTQTGGTTTGAANTGTVDTGTVFVADVIPDTISFVDILNADLTTEYLSDIVDISGINTGVLVSITGSNGMYKINSGVRSNISGLIYSGDVIQVKMYSSDNYSTKKELILSVGDSDIVWSTTTQDEDIIIACDSGDITVLNPLPDDILKGNINIQRSYNNTDCSQDELTIKLRDANTQYLTLGTVSYSDTNNSEFSFDSSLLYSGFYNIYNGVDLSGNDILIYTGDYSGVNTKYFSGHKLAILNSAGEIMYEGDYFTIDNLDPEISNIDLAVTNENNGYVGLDGTIDLTFDSSEELSGVQVTILGSYAILQSHIDNTYTYTMDLSPNNTAGSIIYNIEFEDLAGNTGYIEGSNNIYFDNSSPFINNLEFTHTSNIVSLVLSTDENSKINFAYNISGSNIGGTFESEYTPSHNHIFTGIQSDKIYNYTLSIYDIVNNTVYIGGYFTISGNNIIYDYEVISSDDMIVDTGFENPEDETTDTTDTAETTGAIVSNTPANTFKTEIEKFKTCKETLSNTTILEIPVRKYKARLEMPELEKSYVRKLVSAFSIVLFERIADAGLSEDEINDLTKEFNNFLVILKLVRDDENECEQNLSNYYMSKFRKSLIEYNLAE